MVFSSSRSTTIRIVPTLLMPPLVLGTDRLGAHGVVELVSGSNADDREREAGE